MEDKTIQVANTSITFFALIFTIIGTIYTIKSFHYAKAINENANKINNKIDTLILNQNNITSKDSSMIEMAVQASSGGTAIAEKNRKGDNNFK